MRALSGAFPGRPIALQVWVQTGHTGRQRIASQLVDILKSTGVMVSGPTPIITFSKGTPAAAKIAINPADEDIAGVLATALNPYLRVKFVGEKKIDLEKGHVSIYLHGEPAFAEDGSVTLP